MSSSKRTLPSLPSKKVTDAGATPVAKAASAVTMAMAAAPAVAASLSRKSPVMAEIATAVWGSSPILFDLVAKAVPEVGKDWPLESVAMALLDVERSAQSSSPHARLKALLASPSVATADETPTAFLHQLARHYHEHGHRDAAAAVYVCAFHPGNALTAADVIVMNDYAVLLGDLGLLPSAEQWCTRALNAATRLFGAASDEALLAVANLAVMHYDQGDFARAAELYEEALKGRLALGGGTGLAVAYRNLARALAQLQRWPEVETLMRKALEFWSQAVTVLDAVSPSVAFAQEFECQKLLVESLENQGKMDEQRSVLQAMLTRLEARGEALSPAALALESQLAVLLQSIGRHLEAERHFRAVLAADLRDRDASKKQVLISVNNLAMCLIQQEQTEIHAIEIEKLLRQIMSGHMRELAAQAREALVELRYAQNAGNSREVVDLLTAAHTDYEAVLGDSAAPTLRCLHALAVAEHGIADYEHAEAHYTRAILGYLRLFGPADKRTVQCEHDLAEMRRVQHLAARGRIYDKPWLLPNAGSVSPNPGRKTPSTGTAPALGEEPVKGHTPRASPNPARRVIAPVPSVVGSARSSAAVGSAPSRSRAISPGTDMTPKQPGLLSPVGCNVVGSSPVHIVVTHDSASGRPSPHLVHDKPWLAGAAKPHAIPASRKGP